MLLFLSPPINLLFFLILPPYPSLIHAYRILSMPMLFPNKYLYNRLRENALDGDIMIRSLTNTDGSRQDSSNRQDSGSRQDSSSRQFGDDSNKRIQHTNNTPLATHNTPLTNNNPIANNAINNFYTVIHNRKLYFYTNGSYYAFTHDDSDKITVKLRYVDEVKREIMLFTNGEKEGGGFFGKSINRVTEGDKDKRDYSGGIDSMVDIGGGRVSRGGDKDRRITQSGNNRVTQSGDNMMMKIGGNSNFEGMKTTNPVLNKYNKTRSDKNPMIQQPVSKKKDYNENIDGTDDNDSSYYEKSDYDDDKSDYNDDKSDDSDTGMVSSEQVERTHSNKHRDAHSNKKTPTLTHKSNISGKSNTSSKSNTSNKTISPQNDIAPSSLIESDSSTSPDFIVFELTVDLVNHAKKYFMLKNEDGMCLTYYKDSFIMSKCMKGDSQLYKLENEGDVRISRDKDGDSTVVSRNDDSIAVSRSDDNSTLVSKGKGRNDGTAVVRGRSDDTAVLRARDDDTRAIRGRGDNTAISSIRGRDKNPPVKVVEEESSFDLEADFKALMGGK